MSTRLNHRKASLSTLSNGGSLIERVRSEGGLWPSSGDWAAWPQCEICFGERPCTACSMGLKRLLVRKLADGIATLKENDKHDAMRLLEECGIRIDAS